ncbi:S-adenosylmethionine decarboxylase proenzyme precursor [Planctomycetes bacterium Poly30]|uniref:S-adenosylmethionine decarboxylase proenzyme n=1 Tax=Saltatorellus ferox TaxID=2528018 RepID=A0A518ERP7_9BACT|nr:S-adenosylmethionine decarboxylase proenzyme precursor [Planctomycetes bacterium Poly30]
MPIPPDHAGPPSSISAAPDSLDHAVRDDASGSVGVGQVWSLDASGLDPERLSGEAGKIALQGLFVALIEAADLHPIAQPIWHVFGGEHAGVTGIVALSESHLACHTFPEHGGMTLDLYTCMTRPAPDWQRLISAHLGGAMPVRLQTRVFRRFLAGPQTRP